ncbi:MAG: hypothetical protein LBH59_07790 [Planctomycetaceae bacterium]|nr:hypothetical protein [Planctomycetaceae bacterium]
MIIVLGFVFGLLLPSYFWHVCRGIEICQDEITFVVPVKEGELLNVPLTIRNKCSIPHSITKFGTSCNCTRLVTVNEKPVKGGTVLLPDQTMLLQATIDTRGNEGDSSFDVWTEYETNSKTEVCGCRINVHVLPAIRLVTPLPTLLKYEDGEGLLSKTIILGDAFPDFGVEIESASSESSKLVTCELTKIPDEIVYEGKENLPEWQRRFRKRYAVKFSFDRENSSFTTTLAIRPKDKSCGSFFVPIRYEGSLKKPSVSPSEVVIPLRDVIKKIKRTVDIHVVPGKHKPARDVSVRSFPDGIILLQKQKKPDGWLFQFSIDTAIMNVDNLIVFEDENQQSYVTVPVLFVGYKK